MSLAPRVLVTRAAHQSSGLAEHLLGLGLEPVLIPSIEIVPPASFEVLDKAVNEMGSFDWLVVTSVNAVPVLAERLGGWRAGNRVKVAAIGSATAKALQATGIAVDLVPAAAMAESLAEALLPAAYGIGGQPSRFLIVRAEVGRDLLPDRLRAAGAEVVVAPAYRTVIPAGSAEQLGQLFSANRGRGLPAVTFSSGSTVHNVLALCEAAQVSLPPEALRISIGPITSATLRSFGYPPHAEAPTATIESLAATVLEALRNKDPRERRTI